MSLLKRKDDSRHVRKLLGMCFMEHKTNDFAGNAIVNPVGLQFWDG